LAHLPAGLWPLTHDFAILSVAFPVMSVRFLPLKSSLFGLPDGFPNRVANFISLSINVMRNSLKDF
jgi:hypothetical protein